MQGSLKSETGIMSKTGEIFGGRVNETGEEGFGGIVSEIGEKLFGGIVSERGEIIWWNNE